MTHYAYQTISTNGYELDAVQPIPLPEHVRSYRAAARYVRAMLGSDLGRRLGDASPVRIVRIGDDENATLNEGRNAQ